MPWYCRIMNEQEHQTVSANNTIQPTTTRYECRDGHPPYEPNTVAFVFDATRVSIDTVRSMAESYRDGAPSSWILLFRHNLPLDEDHSQGDWVGSWVHRGPIDLTTAIQTRWMEFRA